MTVHLELEELLMMLAEADYEGKINDPVSFISTQVIIPAGDELWN